MVVQYLKFNHMSETERVAVSKHIDILNLNPRHNAGTAGLTASSFAKTEPEKNCKVII